MNYREVFRATQEQYKKMYVFMQTMDVALGVLRTNTTDQTANYKKMNKRLERIEDTLKIKIGSEVDAL